MEDYYQNTSSSNEHEFSVMSSDLIPAKLPKRNFLAIAGGITAIFLFVTLAGATYYISNQLSNKLGLAPNAPLSDPEAAGCNASLKNQPCGTKANAKCIQCPLGSASYICVVGGVCKWKEDPKTKKQSQVTTGELEVDKNTSLVLCSSLNGVGNECTTNSNPSGASTCSKDGVVNYCCPTGQKISNNKCIGETSTQTLIISTPEPTPALTTAQTPVDSTTKTCTYRTCVGYSCQLKTLTYDPVHASCPTTTCLDSEDCKPPATPALTTAQTPAVSTTKTCTYKTCVGFSCQLKSFTYNPFHDICPTSTCAESEDCKPTPTATKCQNGMGITSRKCSDDEKSMIFCDSDGETSIVACNSGMYCPKSDNKCIAKPTATPVSQTGTYCTPSNAICKLGLPPTCSPCQGKCSGSLGNVYCAPTPTPTPTSSTPTECSDPPNIKKCNSNQKSFSWCTKKGQLATAYCSGDSICPTGGTSCVPKGQYCLPFSGSICKSGFPPSCSPCPSGICKGAIGKAYCAPITEIASTTASTQNTSPSITTTETTTTYIPPTSTPTTTPLIPTQTTTPVFIPTATSTTFTLPNELINPKYPTIYNPDTFGDITNYFAGILFKCQQLNSGGNKTNLNRCFCEETDCQNEVAKNISTHIGDYSGNDTEYQCVQFVELLEYSKPQNRNQAIASACEASNANALANCTEPQYANQYFCPKTTVNKNGFEKSDILVWTNGGDGHTAICTDVNVKPDGACQVWESNKGENGMIGSRKVNNKNPDFGNTSFAGVWRYFPTKEEAKKQGCE